MMKLHFKNISFIIFSAGVALLLAGILNSAHAAVGLGDENNKKIITIFGEVNYFQVSRDEDSRPEDVDITFPFVAISENRTANDYQSEPSISQSGEAMLVFPKVDPRKIEQNLQQNKKNPTRIVIPVILLDAPIEPTKLLRVKINEIILNQWAVPEVFEAGWHPDSAGLGVVGNTVINGHHNNYGEVFRRLVDLQIGDIIQVYSYQTMYSYVVTNILLLQESGVPLQQRLINSRWISRSLDERITLITCWPYESNTHRLIIVASPTP